VPLRPGMPRRLFGSLRAQRGSASRGASRSTRRRSSPARVIRHRPAAPLRSCDARRSTFGSTAPGRYRWATSPIRSRGARPDGLVISVVHTANVIEMMRSANFGYHSAMYLLSPSGALLDSDAASVPRDLLDGVIVSDLLSPVRGGFRTVAGQGVEFALFSGEAHRGFVYVVAVPTERFFTSVRATNRLIFLVAGVLGVLMVPLVFAIAVHLYNPVKQLVELAEETEIATRPGELVDRGSGRYARALAHQRRSLCSDRPRDCCLEGCGLGVDHLPIGDHRD
jgi:hypothetical protein